MGFFGTFPARWSLCLQIRLNLWVFLGAHGVSLVLGTDLGEDEATLCSLGFMGGFFDFRCGGCVGVH